MIKDFEKEDVSINVYLKNGTVYKNKNIPPSPFGAYDRIVAFWDINVVKKVLKIISCKSLQAK